MGVWVDVGVTVVVGDKNGVYVIEAVHLGVNVAVGEKTMVGVVKVWVNGVRVAVRAVPSTVGVGVPLLFCG
jgi:hypothetical protein